MNKQVKLFMVDEEPYFVSLDHPELGDTAIVTVGGQYPSLVECTSQQVLGLINDSKLKLTQAYKVFMKPNEITLTTEQINHISEGLGVVEVETVNGEVKFMI